MIIGSLSIVGAAGLLIVTVQVATNRDESGPHFVEATPPEPEVVAPAPTASPTPVPPTTRTAIAAEPERDGARPAAPMTPEAALEPVPAPAIAVVYVPVPSPTVAPPVLPSAPSPPVMVPTVPVAVAPPAAVCVHDHGKGKHHGDCKKERHK